MTAGRLSAACLSRLRRRQVSAQAGSITAITFIVPPQREQNGFPGQFLGLRGERAQVEIHVMGPQIHRGVDVLLKNSNGGRGVLGVPVADLQVGVGRVKGAEECRPSELLDHLLPAAARDHHPPTVQTPLDPIVPVGSHVLTDGLRILAEREMAEEQSRVKRIGHGNLARLSLSTVHRGVSLLEPSGCWLQTRLKPQ